MCGEESMTSLFLAEYTAGELSLQRGGIVLLVKRNPGEYSECENTSRGGFVKRIAPITRYEFRRYLQAC